MNSPFDRRTFLRMSTGGGVLLLPAHLAGQERGRAKTKTEPDKAEEAEEVAPREDLMREHGVLKRVLLRVP